MQALHLCIPGLHRMWQSRMLGTDNFVRLCGLFFFSLMQRNVNLGESKALNLHYLLQMPFSLSLKGLILFPLWPEETRPGRCIRSTWRRDQIRLIRSDSADLQRDVQGKCEACLRACSAPWMSDVRWLQSSSLTKIPTWMFLALFSIGN